jgi:hypothetical protein
MRNPKDQTHAPRNGVSGKAMAYLRVEKPRFLFLEGLAGAKATADAATVAPLDASAARAGTSVVRAGTSVTRSASSVDRPAAGASTPAPGACSSAASAVLDEGGAGPHLSGGPAPRRFPPPLLPPTTSTPMSSGEKVPAARAVGTLHPSALGAPDAGSPAPSSAPPAPAPAAAPHARALGIGVWAGWTAHRSRPPFAREDKTSESRRHMEKE